MNMTEYEDCLMQDLVFRQDSYSCLSVTLNGQTPSDLASMINCQKQQPTTRLSRNDTRYKKKRSELVSVGYLTFSVVASNCRNELPDDG